MKREAVGTTKMKRLCKLLNVRLYVAVGIMESLWHLTAREAPQGDIGKLSDEDIALGIDWDGPPEELVGALVKARWMDESGTHRLIVHDWHQHADDAVDIRLGRAILLYANGAQPRMSRLSKEEKAKLCALYAHSVRTESHEKPLPVPVPVPLPVPLPVPKENTLPKKHTANGKPSPECLSLYQAYPRHVAPDTAYRAIAKALARKPFAELLAAVSRFATQCRKEQTEVQFIPHPASWFNAGRYDDEAPLLAGRVKTQYELNAEAQLEERRQAIAAAGVVQ